MNPLPLSDRILLVLAREQHTARSLSQPFRTDIHSVRKVLNGLTALGLLDRLDENPTVFALAENADVEYRPGRVLVDLDGRDPRQDADGETERCTAVTTRGSRCKKEAVAGGLCQIHGPPT